MARRNKKKKGKKKQGGSIHRQEARSNSGGDVAAEIDETFHTPETNSAAAAPPLEIPSARDGVDAKGGGGGKGKGAEEREETCLCCQIEFTVAGDGGVAFCCPTSHYMCNECCGIWGEYYNLFEEPFHLLLLTVHVIPIVNSVMLDLDSSYPPKCPQCRALITNETVERQLTSDQLNTFRAHAARTVNSPLNLNTVQSNKLLRAKLEQREKRNILTMKIVQAFDEVDEVQKNIALEAAAQRNEDPLKEWAPPTREECPICFLLLPIDEETETFYRGCCGKSICRGCVYVQLDTLLGAASEEIQEKVLSPLSSCPFCRTELPKSDE